jgi:hypothetical protein
VCHTVCLCSIQLFHAISYYCLELREDEYMFKVSSKFTLSHFRLCCIVSANWPAILHTGQIFHRLLTKLISSTSHFTPEPVSQVTSLKSIPGEELLVIVMRGGDLALMKLDNLEPQVRLYAYWL